MVAYALFYVGHEDKLSSLSKLHDFKKVLDYLNHHSCHFQNVMAADFKTIFPVLDSIFASIFHRMSV
jgi:hypothetical protein